MKLSVFWLECLCFYPINFPHGMHKTPGAIALGYEAEGFGVINWEN